MTQGSYDLNDTYVFPIKMTDDVMKQLPVTAIFTSDFDFLFKDAIKLAERL